MVIKNKRIVLAEPSFINIIAIKDQDNIVVHIIKREKAEKNLRALFKTSRGY